MLGGEVFCVVRTANGGLTRARSQEISRRVLASPRPRKHFAPAISQRWVDASARPNRSVNIEIRYIAFMSMLPNGSVKGENR
jgi:hypothetical protein